MVREAHVQRNRCTERDKCLDEAIDGIMLIEADRQVGGVTRDADKQNYK
jgi:hypothetical protein